VLLGGDDSSASEAEVDNGGPRAKRVAADEGLLDSPEAATDSTTPDPPSNPDGWHDIDDFPETAQRLRLAEQELSTPGSMRPRTSSSRASSESLHDHIGITDCTGGARSEVTICSSARRHQPSLRARESPEKQPVHEDHFHTGRSSAGEHKLEVLSSTLDTDPVNEGKSQQPELEQRDEGPQQGVNNLAAVATIESVGDIYPSDEDGSLRPALSPPCDPLPKSSHDEAGVRSDSDSDNNEADPEDEGKEPHPVKRKRSSSSYDGLMQRKRKRYPKQKSTYQHGPHPKLHRHSSKSYSPPDQASGVTAVSSAEGRLPSPAPSAPQIMDTEMPSDCGNTGGSSSDLPVLTEVTFRPCSQHWCSFTAVVREGCDGRGISFSQLTQLIESIGHVGKINDFTIKPLQQHSFLLTGFSRHTSSRLSSSDTTVLTVAEANRIHNDATRSQLQYGRTVDAAGAVAPRGSRPSSSDHEGDLSDSDPDSSSDDDGRLNKDERGRSSTKNIPWDPIDEQRLLAYKKEDKSWNWIFRKFPGRTENAVLARWNIVRPGGRRAMAKAGVTRLAEEKKPRGRPRKQT
jgi:hypothetical protein